MRKPQAVVVLVLSLGLLPATSNVPQAQAQEEGEAVDQIRASAQAFVKAFDKHDSRALAKMWTADGEYVDENGQRYEGRKAIQAEYASFFSALPDVKMKASIDSIRLLNSITAIEEGHVSLDPLPAGAPVASRYTAIHVNQEGRWLLASVRDTRIEMPSSYKRLQAMSWLVGDWTSDHAGILADVNCRWIAQKSFLQLTFRITQNGQLLSESTQVIGWDASQSQIVSWSFSSGGGRSVGTWSAGKDGWIVQQQGVTADGAPTAAINIWSELQGGALGWRSVVRTVNDEALPDIRDVVLVASERE